MKPDTLSAIHVFKNRVLVVASLAGAGIGCVSVGGDQEDSMTPQICHTTPDVTFDAHAPFWDNNAGACSDAPPPEMPCSQGFPLTHLGFEPPAVGTPCVANADCGDGEFCGADYCRPIDASYVTVCLANYAFVGHPNIAVGGPPDAQFTWVTGGFGSGMLARSHDTCRGTVGLCQIWRLDEVPGSDIEIREKNPLDFRDGDRTVSQHELGSMEQVLQVLNTCHEVPTIPSMPSSLEGRVSVAVNYP